jgi:hydroxyacylglutathione hydrolase
MQVQQFGYNSDNLGYLVWSGQTALAVDGGAAEAMAAFARQRGLTIQAAVNTHGHADHTMGTAQLARLTGATILEPAALARTATLTVGGAPVRVYRTPGHTADSLCFHAGAFLLTGDTLFNGTVGNCFSGDLEGFYRSVLFLMSLPPETVIYAGHDYVHQSMAFARWLEPENRDIDGYLAAYDPNHVHSRLADELRVNPYLRFNQPAMIAVLRQKGFAAETELERWLSLMGIE